MVFKRKLVRKGRVENGFVQNIHNFLIRSSTSGFLQDAGDIGGFILDKE